MSRRSSELAVCALWLVACTPQAGDDYLGESLLSMHGDATISALTGGGAVVPALCFFGDPLHHPAPFNWDTLPADLAAEGRVAPEFVPANAPPGVTEPLVQDRLTYILDVESHGTFPAEFDVDVHMPPPEAALKPLIPGEPRMAVARVCAVNMKHAAVTHRVQQTVFPLVAGLGDPTTRSKKRLLWTVPGSSRYYTEGYACPTPESPISDCTLSSSGDPTLQYEFLAEQVVGASASPRVVYLAEAAPAGSYTAWSLASPNGVAAGYHLYPDAPALWTVCGVRDAAIAELRQLLGAEPFPAEDFRMFPFKANVEDLHDMYLPDNVIESESKIEARLEMQMCQGTVGGALSPDDQTLSIEINQKDDNFNAWVSLQ